MNDLMFISYDYLHLAVYFHLYTDYLIILREWMLGFKGMIFLLKLFVEGIDLSIFGGLDWATIFLRD